MRKTAVLLIVAILISVFTLNSALAYSGADYTSNSSLATKLDNLFQGKVSIFSNTTKKFPVGSDLGTGGGYSWANNKYSGGECYAYAQAAYYYLFGDVPYHGGGGYSNSTVVSGVKGLNSLSNDILAFAGVGCGAYIRTTINSDGSYHGSQAHSMILLRYNSSSITYLQASGSKRTVKVTTESWSDFNKNQLSGRSRYIAHIVQPKLTAWSVSLPNPATTLEFRNVTYPKTFKINTTSGWYLSGGILVSNCELKTLNVKIIKEDGTIISQMASPRTLSGKVFGISSLDGEGKDNGQKFSKITTAGNYIWVMTATDSSGKTVTLEMPFTAVTSGSTVTATASSSSSSTTQTETTLTGIYRFNNNNDSHVEPVEASTKVSDYSQGDIVFVTNSVVNQYGNTWYKLTDGSYIWSNDVDKVNLSETAMTGTYSFTRNDESRRWPYEASPLIHSYSSGSTISIVASVVNTYGNTWYKLADGSYVWSGDVAATSTATTLAFQNVTYPTNYKIGQSGGYSLSGGTLVSDQQLRTITTTIQKSDGTNVSGPTTRNISGYSYSIKNLDTKDGTNNGVRFSYINSSSMAGNYVWILTATDAGGRTLTMRMPFTASSSSTVSSSMSLSYNDLDRKVTAIELTTPEGISETETTYYGHDTDSKSFVLQAWVSPSDASNPHVTWTSSNEDVLQLSSTEPLDAGGTLGRFNIVGVGTSLITATAQDGSGKTASYTLRYYVSSVSLAPAKSTIYINETTEVIPSIQPSIADRSSFTWSSSNPSVASVDTYGNVTGVSKGTATITAAATDGSGKQGTCNITIESNIANLSASMWEAPFPEEDFRWGLPIHSIRVGEIFTIETNCEFLQAPSNESWSYTVDNTGGLVKLSGYQSTFKATATGDYNIYYNYYENNTLVETLTIPIVVLEEQTISANTQKTFSIGAAGHRANIAFVPTETMMYNVTIPSPQMSCKIYDANWNCIANGTTAKLYAGTKYYLALRFENDAHVGSFTVKVVPDVVSGTCGSDLSWTVSNTTLTISGTGEMDDYGTGGPWFWLAGDGTQAHITEIILNPGITYIGRHAFGGADISSIEIPNTVVHIGSQAFWGCANLTSVSIPDSVTTMDDSVFTDCISLSSVDLPLSLINLDSHTFYGCSSLTSLSFPAGVSYIGSYSFYNCSSLTSVTIPDSVTSIGDAFINCSALENITIPESVTWIGDGAFDGCTNLTITCYEGSAAHNHAVAKGIPYILIGGQCGSNASWSYHNGTLIIRGSGAMNDYSINGAPWTGFNSSITYLIVEEGITTTGTYAFYGMNLNEISLPSTLKTIRGKSFLNCSSLTTAMLPEGLENIEVDAFAGCTNLSVLSLPSTLKTIGGDAFQSTSITSVIIPSSVKSIAGNPFCCTKISTITVVGSQYFKVVDNVLYTKNGTRLVAYPCASTLTKYSVVEGTTEIGQNAFYGQMNLSEIVIPEGVTQIGGYSSYRSNSLERVYIPSTVTTIGGNAYGLCPNLTIYCTPGSAAQSYATENNIPFEYYGGKCGEAVYWTLVDGALTISGTGEMYAYDWINNKSPWYGNSAIKSIRIKEGVTSIGYAAFCACEGLHNVTLPSSLTTIGDYAFDNDTSLTAINVASNNRYFCSVNGVLYSKDMKTIILCPPSAIRGTFNIPNGVVEIYKFAFKNCKDITTILIPESIKRIGAMAFFLCTKLEYINLHDGIESIGEGAFSDCSALTNINIPAKITRIESETFGCTGIRDVYIPENITYIAYWAFRDCDGLVISCYEGSSAHQFAVSRGFDFVLLDTPLNRADFVLPESTRIIEAEAFSGVPAKRVRLPEACTQIGAKAFAYCQNLVAIYIPADCTSIATNAFIGIDNLTIFGTDGSYAEFYANKYGFDFVAIETD